jgi:hypothetical protein
MKYIHVYVHANMDGAGGSSGSRPIPRFEKTIDFSIVAVMCCTVVAHPKFFPLLWLTMIWHCSSASTCQLSHAWVLSLVYFKPSSRIKVY